VVGWGFCLSAAALLGQCYVNLVHFSHKCINKYIILERILHKNPNNSTAATTAEAAATATINNMAKAIDSICYSLLFLLDSLFLSLSLSLSLSLPSLGAAFQRCATQLDKKKCNSSSNNKQQTNNYNNNSTM